MLSMTLRLADLVVVDMDMDSVTKDSRIVAVIGAGPILTWKHQVTVGNRNPVVTTS